MAFQITGEGMKGEREGLSKRCFKNLHEINPQAPASKFFCLVCQKQEQQTQDLGEIVLLIPKYY